MYVSCASNFLLEYLAVHIAQNAAWLGHGSPTPEWVRVICDFLFPILIQPKMFFQFFYKQFQ